MVDINRIFTNMEVSLKNEFQLLDNDASVELFNRFDESCEKAIYAMRMQLRFKIPVGVKFSIETRINRIVALQELARLRVRNLKHDFFLKSVESCFKSRIRTALVINVNLLDPICFFDEVQETVLSYVSDALKDLKSIKVCIIFSGVFKLHLQVESDKYFSSRYRELTFSSDLKLWYENDVKSNILAQMEDFQERESGWTFAGINNLSIQVNKYTPFRAGSYVDAPDWIKNKKAVVNIRSGRNECFAVAVISGLFPVAKNVSRLSSYPAYQDVLNFDGIEFPVSLKDIPRFEKKNADISVNVFCVEKKEVLTLYKTKIKRARHVNLLMLTQGNVSHYCWIKSMSKLLSTRINRDRHKKYVCDGCLHYFLSQERLNNHTIECNILNDCIVKLPAPGMDVLKFKDHSKKLPVPFIVYADTECLLGKVSSNKPIKDAIKEHKIYAIGYRVECSYDKSYSNYQFKRSLDCDVWFAEKLSELAHEVNEVIICFFK